MGNMKILMNGLVKENPTFVLLLGMCPTLATTTSAVNGLSMGLATMAVLVCTNFVISCIKKLTPDMVRIPVFIVVIAAFVTILEMFMNAYAPDSINQALGIYIPLIVVNCIILGRAEFRCQEHAAGEPLRRTGHRNGLYPGTYPPGLRARIAGRWKSFRIGATARVFQCTGIHPAPWSLPYAGLSRGIV